MKRQSIIKDININASPEKVWKVLQDDQLIRVWCAHFSEGTHAIATWEEGTKAVFKDSSGMGMIARIVSNKPNELLDMAYEGILTPDGKEDYESEEAQDVKGGHETYRLSRHNGTTNLAISCDMSEPYFDHMSQAWDKALNTIKVLAES